MLPNGTNVVVNEGTDTEYIGVIVDNDGTNYTIEVTGGTTEEPAKAC